MAKIPEFLLKSLYVKGSLRLTANGFQFKLKNDLGLARIIGVHPLLLDRKPIPMENCSFLHGEHEAFFTDVNADQSVLMRKGEALTISIRDLIIKRGRHYLGIHVIVKDMGSVRFTVSDQVK